MKILHISYSLSEQSAAYRLAYAQEVHQGHKVFFLIGRNSSSAFINSRRIASFITGFFGFGAHIIDHIVSLFLLKTDEIFSLGVGLPLKNYLFRKIILDSKPDIVHVHWGGYGFVPLKLLQRLSDLNNIKVVVTTHDYHYFTGGCHVPMDCPEHQHNCRQCPMARGFIAKNWINRTRRQSNVFFPNSTISFVSPSSFTASFIQTTFEDINNKIIPNTAGDIYCSDQDSLNMNIEQYKNFREMNRQIPTLLVVGVKVSSRQNKGVDVLADCVKRMSRLGIKYNIITVGEYVKLEVNGSHLHHENRSVDQMKKLYSVADLCLVPSRYETFSQVTLESIQMATPVVAFDLSGPADIIHHGVSGFLVRSFDEEEFSKAAMQHLNYKSQNLELMKKIALETTDRFSPIKIADLYEQLYKKTISQPDK